MSKKKVMIFMDWYLPGNNAGGPVRTCANMVARLRDYFDFLVVTRDTDLKATEPYGDVLRDAWNVRNDGSRVYYFSSANLSYRNIRNLIASEKPDAIHINSLYSFYFTLMPLRAARRLDFPLKVVVGPRGMLSPGALEIKPVKKKMFLAVARLFGLFNHVNFHASTAIEADEIKRTFGSRARVLTAIDLAPEWKSGLTPRIKNSGSMSLFYLGRISPVKNLLQCIEALAAMPPGLHITFDVYGPVEDPGYWETCLSQAGTLPASVTFRHAGVLDHADLGATLARYHFLFLLTENENYGHAIVEALTCGCPVLISNRTPWKNLTARHVGWDVDLDNDKQIHDTLIGAAGMNQADYDTWSRAAYQYGNEISGSSQALSDNIALFN